MNDPKFAAFLQSEINATREAIANGSLSLDEIIAAAQDIKKTEARIERMNNPRTRKPKPEVISPVLEAA